MRKQPRGLEGEDGVDKGDNEEEDEDREAGTEVHTSRRMSEGSSKNKPFVDVIVKAQIHAGGRGKGTFK